MGNGSADGEESRGMAYGKWKCRWGRESWNGLWEMEVPMGNGVVEWIMGNESADEEWGCGMAYGKWKCRWRIESWNGL